MEIHAFTKYFYIFEKHNRTGMKRTNSHLNQIQVPNMEKKNFMISYNWITSYSALHIEARANTRFLFCFNCLFFSWEKGENVISFCPILFIKLRNVGHDIFQKYEN